jgi:hypothetical protein
MFKFREPYHMRVFDSAAAFFKRPIFSDYRFIFGVFFLATLVTAIQNTFFLDTNNYKIFYHSYYHLKEGVSLYNEYPQQYYDHYHYAPAFAVLFMPVFLLPFKVGLFIWHFLFGAAWIYGIWKMPFSRSQKVFAYWFGLNEYLTAVSNAQTNPLIAVIPLLAFVFFQRGHVFFAAAVIMLGFHIKIYSVVAVALFLLYPEKLKFLLSCLFWFLLIGILPGFVGGFDKLEWHYSNWINQLMIKTDHDKTANISVHRIIHQLFSDTIPTLAIVAGGVVLFCTVYIRRKFFEHEHFRMLMVASICIFQVIFQPAAESATYITAVTGCIIYWIVSPKQTIDIILIIACFLLTIMSPTDLVPNSLKDAVIKPYVLKAWPCVLIWLRVIYLMHTMNDPKTPKGSV